MPDRSGLLAEQIEALGANGQLRLETIVGRIDIQSADFTDTLEAVGDRVWVDVQLAGYVHHAAAALEILLKGAQKVA